MLGSASPIIRYDMSMPMELFDLEANRLGYIGPKVMKPRLVGIQAADVGKIPANQLISVPRDTSRAPGAGFIRTDQKMDKYSYSTGVHGVEAPVDDIERAIFSGIIDADMIGAARALNELLQSYEVLVAGVVMNAATFTGNLTAAAAVVWDTNPATALPITDIQGGMEKARLNSGIEPNIVAMNFTAFRAAMNTQQVIDRVKYTKTLTWDELAGLLAAVVGVRNLVVAGMPGGLMNTSSQSNTSPTFARIWPSPTVFIGRAAETSDPREPCFGRTFMWNSDGAGPGSAGDEQELAVIVEQYREEKIMSTVHRARTTWDTPIMYPNAGFNLTGCTAAA